MHIRSVEPRERVLTVHWSDASTSDFPYLYLRDNCPSGFHAQTHERVFDLLSVPETLRPTNVKVENQGVVIDWEEDPSHRTFLETDWLADHRPGRRAPDAADIETVSWDAGYIDRLVRVPAADLLGNASAMKDWLVNLRCYGLSVVTGLFPGSEEAGIAFGETIGFLRARSESY